LIACRLTVSASLLRRLAILPVTLLTTWFIRGGILTGNPLYPSRHISLPVDWRVSAEQADAEAAWITMSARNLNTNTIETSATWLPEWLKQVLTRGDLFAHIIAPLLVAVVAAGVLLARRRLGGVPWRRGAWLLVPVFVSLLAWWLTAPHTRMAQGPFWLMAAALAACAVGGTPSLSIARRSTLLTASVALFAILAGRIALGEWYRAPAGERTRVLIGTVAAQPTADGWLAPMPSPDLLEYVTPLGVDLTVPRVDNSCWNGPLLCTPHPAPLLVMREPGSPGHGFRAPSVWQPMWFPNPWIPFLSYWRCVQHNVAADGSHPNRASIEMTCRASSTTKSAGVTTVQ
jgi:hypothetical protein